MSDLRGSSVRAFVTACALHPLVPLIALAATAAFIVAQWLDESAGRPSLFFLTGLFVASLAYHRIRLGRPMKAAADTPA